jgi:hypothetical protein
MLLYPYTQTPLQASMCCTPAPVPGLLPVDPPPQGVDLEQGLSDEGGHEKVVGLQQGRGGR